MSSLAPGRPELPMTRAAPSRSPGGKSPPSSPAALPSCSRWPPSCPGRLWCAPPAPGWPARALAPSRCTPPSSRSGFRRRDPCLYPAPGPGARRRRSCGDPGGRRCWCPGLYGTLGCPGCSRRRWERCPRRRRGVSTGSLRLRRWPGGRAAPSSPPWRWRAAAPGRTTGASARACCRSSLPSTAAQPGRLAPHWREGCAEPSRLGLAWDFGFVRRLSGRGALCRLGAPVTLSGRLLGQQSHFRGNLPAAAAANVADEKHNGVYGHSGTGIQYNVRVKIPAVFSTLTPGWFPTLTATGIQLYTTNASASHTSACSRHNLQDIS